MRRSPYRRLHRANLHAAAQTVDDERRESFAVDVFRDDEERTTAVDDRFENRNEVLNVRNFLFEEKDVSVFENAFHLLRVGNEVRREVAAVELHPFDPFDFRLERFAFVDGDDAVFADFFHRVGEEAADFRVVVRRNGADLRDARLAVFDGNRHLLQFGDDVFDRFFHPGLHVERVDAGDDRFHPFVEDRFGENRRGGGAVADDVARFRRDFANHTGAHIFVNVFEVDFFSDRNAVLRNERRTEAFLDNDVATARAERNFDGASQFRNAAAESFASLLIESDHFRHCNNSFYIDFTDFANLKPVNEKRSRRDAENVGVEKR